MVFLKLLAIISVLCVVAVVGLHFSYPWLYPTDVIRYRLTVNAVVGGQPRHGSGVVEVRVERQPQFVAETPSLKFGVTGEAIFVDLGDGRNLVAALAPGSGTEPDAVGLLFKAFHIPYLPSKVPELRDIRGERHLKRADWPAFVTFRNVANPYSAEPVNPSALETAFGVSVRVENVTLAVTEDEVTHNLEQRLPWLSAPLGNQDILALTAHIHRDAFIRNDPTYDLQRRAPLHNPFEGLL
jgi:hypothetical protein